MACEYCDREVGTMPSMPRQKLSSLLSALHEQLKGDTPIASEDKEMLVSVLQDIEGKLADSQYSNPDDAAGLGDKISETIGRFEADHPTLTKTLLEITKALKQI